MAITVPDLDDMLHLADEIRGLTCKKMLLEVEIKAEESDVTRIMTTDPNYMQNGKTPSMSYIESTYQYTGLDGKLLEKRRELADVTSSLELSKLKFDVYKMKLDLYRTEAANNRNSQF